MLAWEQVCSWLTALHVHRLCVAGGEFGFLFLARCGAWHSGGVSLRLIGNVLDSHPDCHDRSRCSASGPCIREAAPCRSFL